MRRRHHLKQHLRKRHGGRQVSIRSCIIQTPLTKNGENSLRHPPSQTPGHQYDGPTRRRQARAVRDRARVAKHERRLRTCASTPPAHQDHQDPPSQEYFKSISFDRGGPRPLRRSNSGTDRHHRGCVRDQKATTKKNKFYLLTKVKSSNHEKISSSDPHTNKLRATSKSKLKLRTMTADCGFCGRDKRY